MNDHYLSQGPVAEGAAPGSANYLRLTEEEIAAIERGSILIHGSLIYRMISEIRHLQSLLESGKEACALSAREQLAMESTLLAMTVERDNLAKMLEDANQREQLLIEKAREMKQALGWFTGFQCTMDTCGVDACGHQYARAALGISNERPVPMCKPDPMADVFPPARGEGRPS